jgi:hypothetical protein
LQSTCDLAPFTVNGPMDLGHDLKFGKFEKLKNMYLYSKIKWKLLDVNIIGFYRMFC